MSLRAQINICLLLICYTFSLNYYCPKLFLQNFSVIGSLLIVIGLYIVLWGKGRELKQIIEHTRGSVQVQPLEIITTKLVDAKSLDIDNNNDIKSSH